LTTQIMQILATSNRCPWCARLPRLVLLVKGWQVGCTYSNCPVNPVANDDERERAIEKWNLRILS
jgi:hypothetical protein